MLRIILIESLLIILLLIGLFLAIKSAMKNWKKKTELEHKIEEIKKYNAKVSKFNEESLEKQKNYRKGDDDSNFNASLDFLHNSQKKK